MAKKLNEIILEVETRLKSLFSAYTFDAKNRFFVFNNNVVIRITGFTISNEDVIVAEYGDSLEEAKKNMMEDGDLWYISEMTPEEIAEAIFAEASE